MNRLLSLRHSPLHTTQPFVYARQVYIAETLDWILQVVKTEQMLEGYAASISPRFLNKQYEALFSHLSETRRSTAIGGVFCMPIHDVPRRIDRGVHLLAMDSSSSLYALFILLSCLSGLTAPIWDNKAT